MHCVVIHYFSGLGFRKAATSYCCSTETAHFLLIQNRTVNHIPWMYLDSPAPPDTRRLPTLAASIKPLAKTLLVPSSGWTQAFAPHMQCLCADPETTLCCSSAESAGLPRPPSPAQPPLEWWSAFLSGIEHEEAAQTVVLNESFCLASERASKYISLLLQGHSALPTLIADKQRIQLDFPFSFPLSNRAQKKNKPQKPKKKTINYCSKCIYVTSAASIIFWHTCKVRETSSTLQPSSWTTPWALPTLLLPLSSLDTRGQIQSTRAELVWGERDQLI